MSTPQKPRNVLSFIDFIPAEVRENKTWKVVYYVKCPFENKLKRKENRVKPLKSITERRKLGKRMVLEINRKLERGWNPFLNDKEERGFVKFIDAQKTFLNRVEKEVLNEDKRPDTLRAYKSFLNNILIYLREIKEHDMFVVKFNNDLVRDFLDHIYYDRDNSARTRNNYLNFIKTFSDWLINHKYISVNPTTRIELIPEKKKERCVIPDNTLSTIFNHLENYDPGYFTICLICYYCFIRRTEMTKLKVSDVILKNGIIYISKEVSKNKKSCPVTIPNALLPCIINHLKNAKNTDYLFSDNYLPGPNSLAPKKISDQWTKIREDLKLPKKYQWYSLKDTGITNMLKIGVPTISVRDQARHHSIIQTEAYTPKEVLKANTDIKAVSFVN